MDFPSSNYINGFFHYLLVSVPGPLSPEYCQAFLYVLNVNIEVHDLHLVRLKKAHKWSWSWFISILFMLQYSFSIFCFSGMKLVFHLRGHRTCVTALHAPDKRFTFFKKRVCIHSLCFVYTLDFTFYIYRGAITSSVSWLVSL